MATTAQGRKKDKDKMKVAYFDCFSGISGDMILGALIDAGLNPGLLMQQLSKLNIQGLDLDVSNVIRQGISCTRVKVRLADGTIDSDEEYLLRPPLNKNRQKNNNDLTSLPKSRHHSTFSHSKNILDIIQKSELTPAIRKKSCDIFHRLIEAESKVHGCDSQDVHLHEVGAIDAIVDVVGSVVGLDLLKIDKVYSSPLSFGTGFVSCAHGRYPVPVPGVLALCKDVPYIQTDICAELVTPTGAAIITTLASAFGSTPTFYQDSIGYGAGLRDLEEQPNALRIRLGQLSHNLSKEQLIHVEANIDDMNPEIYSYLFEILFQNGAREVFLTPITMKKGRPGHLLGVLVEDALLPKITETILSETTTLGVRYYEVGRQVISRKTITVKTHYGQIRVKVGQHNTKEQFAPEYEDCATQARQHKIPLLTVYEAARKAATED
ncbi:MAG: nickel pincer cofactor biosynthesis protein LarC [Candidatus Latescibacterota bacterium]|nr:nickel pincer cofactor biosynthesis protein LarC [Candidatus Latescibacterota bacterium]